MVLRLDGLTKDFTSGWVGRAPRRALDRVSFDLARGDVFGLLGPNGAGKTTTLKLIMGLLRPTAGAVTVFGLNPLLPSARRPVGFLPELPAFPEHLTAHELLHYLAGLSGVPGPARGARVDEVLHLVGLTTDRHRRLRQYSKGMLQRVGLAQALVHAPELVILDEPMSGLDPLGRRDVRELIFSLRDSGKTVLFSSHILTDAESLCSRVAILHHGRVTAAGTVADLTRAHQRGWEVEAIDLSPAAVASLQDGVNDVTRIAHGRYLFTLPASARPEPLVAAVAAAGGAVVSVAAVRASLEDVFMEQVS
jgi:ABC-2 type transport system ATP-binding protein